MWMPYSWSSRLSTGRIVSDRGVGKKRGGRIGADASDVRHLYLYDDDHGVSTGWGARQDTTFPESSSFTIA